MLLVCHKLYTHSEVNDDDITVGSLGAEKDVLRSVTW